MDAAMTAKHLGARDVYVVYRRSFQEMPAWDEERNACLAEGIHFLVLSQPINYETDDKGTLTGLRVARTELGEEDSSGRRKPNVIAGSEDTLPVGLVIEALGQRVDARVKEALKKLHWTDGGLLETRKGTQRTSQDNVFAGGDIVNGGTTAVQGIADGMKAAEEIDTFLRDAQ